MRGEQGVIEYMLRSIARQGRSAAWGTCSEARTRAPEVFIAWTQAGNMPHLAGGTAASHQVLVF